MSSPEKSKTGPNRREFLQAAAGALFATGIAGSGLAEEIFSDPKLLFDGSKFDPEMLAMLESRGFKVKKEKGLGTLLVDPQLNEEWPVLSGGKISVQISIRRDFRAALLRGS